MELYVLDESLNSIGIIDSAESVIWAKRYNDVGDFEIHTKADPEIVKWLSNGHYIKRMDDDMVGIIKKISIDTSTDEGDYITAKGEAIESIIGQRVIWEQTILTGTAENGIRKLLNENIISPSKETRKIENFVLDAAKGYTETIDQQFTGDNLLDAIMDICKTFNFGFKVKMGMLNGFPSFIFSLYKGIDRSRRQNINPWVVFSPGFDNLASTTYEYSTENFKNVALILGEGEGKSRTRVAVGNAEGLDRYEIMVDARNISSNNGEVTATEYKEQLRQNGRDKLAENLATELFDGEIVPDRTYTYGKDYNLGDIVTVQNEYGITANARISEIIESEDETGRSIIPTFEYLEGVEWDNGD